MRISVLLPVVPANPREALPFAELVEQFAGARLWQGYATAIEAHHLCAYLVGAGHRIPVGFGVSLMFAQHPFQAALNARSAALVTGHPVAAGFGPGALLAQQSFMGREYSSQLGACREYISAVKQLLSGARVDLTGEYFHVRGQLPPCPSPTIEVGLGVLREKAAGLAGEIADAAVTWLTPARYIAQTLAPAITAGALRTRRTTPPRIITIIPVALARAGRNPAEIALASSAAHLKGPHYQHMLRSSGLRLTGEPEGDAEQLVRQDAFLYGDRDELAGKLTELHEAGVDEIVLNTIGVAHTNGLETALQECSAILQHMDRTS
ncbi:LLM class flavin-dependent oxidoreductase [Streptomyces sp. NPDC056534]|uniref:LLM class flavin-dependent oxidoreductase n=1 Tax=Streptomyces sp. NPDC056534 TaxID=3345857 RepID=UPI003674CF73